MTVQLLFCHSSCSGTLQSDKQKQRVVAELSADSSARVAILLVSFLKTAISNYITRYPQPLTGPLVYAPGEVSVVAPEGTGP